MRLAVPSGVLSCDTAFWMALSPKSSLSASLMPVSAVFSTTDNGSLEEFNDTVKEACTIDTFSCALALARTFTLLSSLAWTGVAAVVLPDVAETGVAMKWLLLEYLLIIGRLKNNCSPLDRNYDHTDLSLARLRNLWRPGAPRPPGAIRRDPHRRQPERDRRSHHVVLQAGQRFPAGPAILPDHRHHDAAVPGMGRARAQVRRHRRASLLQAGHHRRRLQHHPLRRRDHPLHVLA